MVLKYLEIQGFKSFPDKTKITFNQGLTAVVGPNGSGKSNISDAIRWVMGEQSNKSLRGSNMEDVIFTGTKTRKSQGFAQVSLSIDNTDRTLPVEKDEVIITRRYSRSGDSDYLINGSNVRLKDINELFMDTGLGKDGYAMVGQGRIAEIVQSKSDERRIIFEEAAGISKFRSRRNEAQKKLNLAEENLVRLRDILSELEGRVEPLRIQSEKAKEFIELSDKKKTAEISIWFNTLEQSNKLLKDESDKILARNIEHKEVETEIEKVEQEIQSIYNLMQQCLVDIDNLRKEKDNCEQEISQAQSNLAVCENNILHNNNNKERIIKEIESYNNSQENLKLELIKNQEEKLINSNKVKDINSQIKEKEQQLLLLSQRSEDFSSSATLLNTKINNLNITQSEYRMTLNQLRTQVEEEKLRFENNNSNLENRKENLKYIEEEFENANELSNHLKNKLTEYNNILQGYRLKLKSKNDDLLEHQKEYSKQEFKAKEKIQKANLLQDLEKNLEGFAYSVKSVLNKSKQGVLSGILGTVSQLITVPQEYQTAIEIAIGQALQNIVVETEEDGKKAINYLKRENSGRATFLPLTSVKGNRLTQNGVENEQGFISIGSDLLKFNSKYQGIVNYLLGRIVIVDNIDNAVLIAKKYNYKFKIVTLDGQVLNVGGAMTGGSKNKSQGFLSRKTDIDNLLKEAETIRQECLQMKEVEGRKLEEISTIKRKISKVENEIITVNQDIIRCEGEQKRLSLQIEQEKQLLTEMLSGLSNYKDKMDSLKNKIEDTNNLLLDIDKKLEEAKQKLKSVEGQSDDYLENKNKLLEEISNLKYLKIEIQKDIENLNNLIDNLQNKNDTSNEQLTRLNQELLQIQNTNSEIEKNISENKLLINTLKEKSKNSEIEVSNKMNLRNELEEKTTILRKDEKVLSVQKERLSQQLARLEERKLSIQKEYDIIIGKLWDEYQLTKSEAMQYCIEVDDISKLNRDLVSLKQKIRALGSVNVSAIDEYKEVSERYEFLNNQIKDVEHSKAELLKMIEELTQTMKEIFLQNFNLINSNFKRIFVELFGGGKAELKLVDDSDILNCGIEIFVEPPGKIIKSLSLLSGGEQAFIAIAIYFAILKVRPAPFCVLDEIEAALDDVNVSKYAKYLRLMSDNTQFIMITHRRGTMEEADVLYGVTMQEDGISKVLQLNVSEIESKMELE